jgi:hypothetical protein
MNKLLEKAVAEVSGLPARQQEAIAARMLEEVRRLAPQRRGRWAEVAARLSLLDPLEGESEAFVAETRAFRDKFGHRDGQL